MNILVNKVYIFLSVYGYIYFEKCACASVHIAKGKRAIRRGDERFVAGDWRLKGQATYNAITLVSPPSNTGTQYAYTLYIVYLCMYMYIHRNINGFKALTHSYARSSICVFAYKNILSRERVETTPFPIRDITNARSFYLTLCRQLTNRRTTSLHTQSFYMYNIHTCTATYKVLIAMEKKKKLF